MPLSFFQKLYFFPRPKYSENFPFFPVFQPLPPYICVFLSKSSYFSPANPYLIFLTPAVMYQYIYFLLLINIQQKIPEMSSTSNLSKFKPIYVLLIFLRRRKKYQNVLSPPPAKKRRLNCYDFKKIYKEPHTPKTLFSNT